MFAILFIILLLTIIGFILTKKLIKKTWVRVVVWVSTFIIVCIICFFAIAKTITDFYSTRSGPASLSKQQGR